MIELSARERQLELDRLEHALEPPCSIDPYRLTGLVARTETALVYIATGGLLGDDEGILKLTTRDYAPLLERELAILVRCARVEVDWVIRPSSADPLHMPVPRESNMTTTGMALPLYRGGNLVHVLARRGRRALGPSLALTIGFHVGSILRALLTLPRPLIHGDVRLENVLLPTPQSDLTQLTLVDFDAARELRAPLPGVASDPEAATPLVRDVNGFGELLYQAATGKESLRQAIVSTGNAAFDETVMRCLASAPDIPHSYICLADEALWRDLQKAADFDAHIKAQRGPLWRR